MPKKLSDLINARGFDAIHTLDLPDKDTTKDSYLKELAISDNRILITKDDDFLQSYLVEKKPLKLLLVRTGNISNKHLMAIFEAALNVLVHLSSRYSLVEISQTEIITHE